MHALRNFGGMVTREPTKVLAVAIGAAVLFFLVGYWLGVSPHQTVLVMKERPFFEMHSTCRMQVQDPTAQRCSGECLGNEMSSFIVSAGVARMVCIEESGGYVTYENGKLQPLRFAFVMQASRLTL